MGEVAYPGAVAPSFAGRLWDTLRRYKLEIAFITPLFAYLFAFMGYPIALAIFISFQDRLTGALSFGNYISVVQEYRFTNALLNTVALTGIGLSLELAFGLTLALIMSRKFLGRGVFRAIFLIPLGVSTVVSATAFTFIFSPTGGYANLILRDLGLITSDVRWIFSANFPGNLTMLFTVVIVDMWKVTPVIMLLLLAGLESIDRELYEAAQVDGATLIKQFRHVTLPLLKPFITMALVIRGVDAFRIFALPIILTGGQVPVLSTLAYSKYALRAFNESAAVAVILMLMIMIFAVVYMRLSRAEEVVER